MEVDWKISRKMIERHQTRFFFETKKKILFHISQFTRACRNKIFQSFHLYLLGEFRQVYTRWIFKLRYIVEKGKVKKFFLTLFVFVCTHIEQKIWNFSNYNCIEVLSFKIINIVHINNNKKIFYVNLIFKSNFFLNFW